MGWMSSWAAGSDAEPEYQEPGPPRRDRGKAWLARKIARYREERTLCDVLYRRRAGRRALWALPLMIVAFLPLPGWLTLPCGIIAITLFASATADRIEARIHRKLRGMPVDLELLDD